MPRNLYGNSLPSVAESRDSDIFYDINTGKSYVFDNGQWNELPQTPGGGGGGDLPEPTIADAGKVLGVDDEGGWALMQSEGEVITILASLGESNVVTLGETWQTITDYLKAGKLVKAFIEQTDEGFDGIKNIILIGSTFDETSPIKCIIRDIHDTWYIADSPSDYPVSG